MKAKTIIIILMTIIYILMVVAKYEHTVIFGAFTLGLCAGWNIEIKRN